MARSRRAWRACSAPPSILPAARDVRKAGARDLLARGRAVRGSQGFYAGYLGSYTSCLFSPD